MTFKIVHIKRSSLISTFVFTGWIWNQAEAEALKVKKIFRKDFSMLSFGIVEFAQTFFTVLYRFVNNGYV